MKLLAVDDDPMILELLETAMTISGDHDMVTALSGEQAIEKLKEADTPFDCFLLDIQMPGIDGTTLCSHIRKMPIYRRTPIIMATAMSQKSHIDRAFIAGASDYIMKPFDFVELETRVETACKIAETKPAQQAEDNGEGAQNSAYNSIQKVLNNSLAQSLEEPFEVGNIDGLVGYVAFENYLLTLSISSLFQTAVNAVKIANIESIYGSMSPLEFRGLIAKVGQIIANATEGGNAIFTYRGNGLFLVLRHSKGDPEFAEFEFRVLEAASEMAVEEGWSGTDQRAPHVVVGPTTPMKILNKSKALRKAVDSVEKRCIRAKEVGDAFEQAVRPVSDDAEDLEALRDSYAEILSEYLRDDLTELRGRA